MMVRISCAGVSAGPLWIPPFRLESGELVCLHMPCLSYSEEERLVIQLLTGELSDPNISHNGRIFLADAPICRAGLFGLFRWPRVGAWLQKKAGISAPEAQAIATRLGLHSDQICRLPGSKLLPLPELSKRLGELSIDREMVVHCKSGMRSAKAIAFLKQQGFQKLRNLQGGILAWADRIDHAMPKY